MPSAKTSPWTRKYIIDNYAYYDGDRNRHFVLFPNGERMYFPERVPHNLTFRLDEDSTEDQYARLYRREVVDLINDLSLPRYGLALYLDEDECAACTREEKRIIEDLGRAGRRLMGFCRTNLFKRLESSGDSFLVSVRRHVLRNMVTLHALAHGLPVPIGTQDVAMLDTAISDADAETEEEALGLASDRPDANEILSDGGDVLDAFEDRAARVHEHYATEFSSRFRWLPPELFRSELQDDLRADAAALCGLLSDAGEWDPDRDAKLDALEHLLANRHGEDKVVVFTQFADTADYLARELSRRGLDDVAAVTGDSGNPTALSRRFSPRSNRYHLRLDEDELRVLVATDVLSEGQNLQDSHVVVNYDLPWAIIRLIQRAGRVDRIGQQHDTIHVYSYQPADGVERIIRLHSRLRERLQQNNEVVGSDEQFFDEKYENKLRDLYTERAGSLDEDDDEDVDLVSRAQEIWSNASEEDQKAALELPPMVHATRMHEATADSPCGALVYMRTGQGYDALVRVDEEGQVVSQSLSAILEEAACDPDTPGVERDARHHEWVGDAVRAAYADDSLSGGRLGPPRSTRRKVYERLMAFYQASTAGPQASLTPQMLEQALDAIIKHKLTSRANESLGRQLRLGAPDERLAEVVTTLYEDEKLVVIEEEPAEVPEPDVICSIGLKAEQGEAEDGD